MSACKELASGIKEHLLRCKICFNKMTAPRSLPCLHTYCTNCLETLSRGGGSFKCPECRAVTTPPRHSVSSLPVAFHLNFLLETIQLHDSSSSSVPCCNKGDDDLHDIAAVKCIECNAYYCNTCESVHKLGVSARKHRSVKIEDLNEDHLMISAQKKVSFCDIHKDSPLRYFCLDESCNTPICQDCNAVKHKTHQVIELDTKATKLRTENAKIISEDLQKAEEELLRAKQSIKIAKQENVKQFEENESEILERCDRMYAKVAENEMLLLKQTRKTQDELHAYYKQIQQEVNEKLASLQESKAMLLNMNNFSPDDEITRQNEEMKKKTQTAIEEAVVPEFKVQTVSVVSEGDFIVEGKQGIRKGKENRFEKAFDSSIDSVVKLEDTTIAISWRGVAKESKIFVKSSNTAKEKELKEILEGHCKQAFRMVPMFKEGKEKVVILEIDEHSSSIKILHVEEAEVENLGTYDSDWPYLIAVDEDNNIMFLTSAAIKKITEKGTQTLFEDQEEYEVIVSPWGMTTNVNGDIVVSDRSKPNMGLTIFNKKGEVINSCKDFSEGKSAPYGICTDSEGNIYVSAINCDRVLCLDRTGKFKNYALTKEDGLTRPKALAFHKGTLVVGQANGQIKYFNMEEKKMTTDIKKGLKRTHTAEAGPSGDIKKSKE